MGSQFAIIATTLGGLVLAARYAQTRSFWAVFIEHTIWGWLIFTVGLGRFFFTGVSNVRGSEAVGSKAVGESWSPLEVPTDTHL